MGTGAPVTPVLYALRNRLSREGRHAADVRSARRKWRGWDDARITLPRRRAIRVRCRIAAHASARKSVTVRIRSCKSVGECFEERNDQVLLVIRQTEIAGGHVYIVLNLGQRPASNSLDSSRRAVSRCHGVRILCVTSVVEMHELFKALDITIVKEPLLEIRFWAGLGGRTL